MTERATDEFEADEDEPATYEGRMVDFAERQTKALERLILLSEVVLFLGLVAGVVWLIAFFSSR